MIFDTFCTGALPSASRIAVLEPQKGCNAFAARIALRAAKSESAEERLRSLTKRHPKLLEAQNDLAWLLAERGADLDLALELALTAQAGLEDPEALDTLGWVYLKRGEYRRAQVALEAALSLRPDADSTRERLVLATRQSELMTGETFPAKRADLHEQIPRAR